MRADAARRLCRVTQPVFVGATRCSEMGLAVSCPSNRSMRRLIIGAVVLIGGLALATPARAHKSFIFATIPQGKIEGEVYFGGAEPGRHVTVAVLDPLGNKLGSVVTDEKGRFTFEPRVRCDHRLIADDGMGHRAEYTVRADELPAHLLADNPSGFHGTGMDSGSSGADQQGSQPSSSRVGDSSGVSESLSQQIAALRRDLDRWQARLRLQDILGGVGYILGITGLMFYFLANRSRAPQQNRNRE